MNLTSPLLITACTLAIIAPATAQKKETPLPPPIIGKWDLTVTRKDGPVPSWIEVVLSGRKSLVGRFVGAFGSARPISEISYSDGRFAFSIPVQWEDGDADIRVEGLYANDRVTGTIRGPYFGSADFTGVRSPKLIRPTPPTWGEPIALFDGKTMNGWRARNPKEKNGWHVRGGLLANDKPGNDLVSVRTFKDFKIHAEFRFPKGSNSGLYLRGRHEAQIEDSYGVDPDPEIMGAIYGFIPPASNPSKRPGEWQSYDITLIGRMVTVSLNGVPVITNQQIPGITGGALDSDEGAAGPLMIQGDHGPIEFRKVVITPAK